MAKASKKDRKDPVSTSHPILPRPGTSRVGGRYTLRLQTEGASLRAEVRFSIVGIKADGSLEYKPIAVQTLDGDKRVSLQMVEMDGNERTIPVYFVANQIPEQGAFVLIEVFNPAQPNEKTLDLIWVE